MHLLLERPTGGVILMGITKGAIWLVGISCAHKGSRTAVNPNKMQDLCRAPGVSLNQPRS